MLSRLASLRFPLGENQDRERIEAAIVLAAAGERARFDALAALAERDWRDVLVAGGLAHGDWPARLDAALEGQGQDS